MWRVIRQQICIYKGIDQRRKRKSRKIIAGSGCDLIRHDFLFGLKKEHPKELFLGLRVVRFLG